MSTKRKFSSSSSNSSQKTKKTKASLRDVSVEDYHCTAEQLSSLKSFATTPTGLSLSDLHLLLEKLSTDTIGDVTGEQPQKSYHRLFLSQAAHCVQWLDEFLQCIGWSENRTGFSPVQEAVNVEELLEQTLKVARLALKQRIQVWEDSTTGTETQ
jgi:hypothetical protein